MSDEMHGCPCCDVKLGALLGIEGEGFAAANVVALKSGVKARAGAGRLAGGIAGNTVLAPHLCGDDHAAWARWTMRSPAGSRTGVGIYKVVDGKLAYYRDYMDPAAEG